MKQTLWETNGIRYAFYEVPGWSQHLYCWRGLRTSATDDRCVWLEAGGHEAFLRLISLWNETNRQFRFEALSLN